MYDPDDDMPPRIIEVGATIPKVYKMLRSDQVSSQSNLVCIFS